MTSEHKNKPGQVNAATPTDANASPLPNPPLPQGSLLVARVLTLAGYFGLLLLILNWFTWYSPPLEVPRAFLLIVLLLPLILVLRGLLHARVRAHFWASFLALWYFIIGVDVIFNYASHQLLGWGMAVLSVCFYAGSVWYSWIHKRAHKQALKRQLELNSESAPPTP